ncbi:MAG: hypothetical protein H6Q30_1835 [Bacteroidetes bacterium]|nr:hypothetical protein [Bacteroidota bacterium]
MEDTTDPGRKPGFVVSGTLVDVVNRIRQALPDENEDSYVVAVRG